MDWQCQKGEVLPPEPPHPFKSFSLKRNWLAVKIWNAEGKVSGIRFKKKSILWNRKEIKQLIPSWMKIEFGDESQTHDSKLFRILGGSSIKPVTEQEMWRCLQSQTEQGVCSLTWPEWEAKCMCSSCSQFSSVQFSHSVMSDSLRPHESQHARPPCPPPTPGVHPCATTIEPVL